MLATRFLIVNADDFGQSSGINRGIIQSFENGIVTSASLMVRWPAASEAASYAREHPHMSVGLHIDLGEWAYRDGEWISLYEVVPRDDSAAVAEEVSRQLATFVSLTGKQPSHVDTHQHVHRSEPVRSILIDTTRKLGVPLRLHSEAHYCGAFYGQTDNGESLLDQISIDALSKMLDDLGPGITELGCHPALEVEFDTMYTTERLRECEVLCDSRVRQLLAQKNIQLCSFHEVSLSRRR
jgi:chitin disaccharide deacetylase